MTAFDLPADFQSHHIEGYAFALLERGEDAHFSAPAISHIEGNLWSGGCIGGALLPSEFVHVVSLYPWERWELHPGTTRDEFRIYDSPSVKRELFQAAVDSALGALDRGPVLVHCQAGLNRSGVVSALVLVARGWSPKDAIALLREKRCPAVLCNRHFERFVLAGGSS